MLRPILPFVFGMAMAVVILWGAFLGFINGYNAPYWVLTLITGLVALTLFDIVSEDWEGTDHWEPRRTFNRTSSRIVHIERPSDFKRRFDDEDD